MSYYYYSYDYPPPLVDHIHERTHQHRTLLDQLTRRKSLPEEHPNQPDVDLRDTPDAYLVEVEVPGVKNTEQITVHWTTSRNLIIRGGVLRPDGSKNEDQTKDQPEVDSSDAQFTQDSTKKSNVHDPALLVGERRIGPFRRIFNFPSDVDMHNLSVKLDAGLLIVRAPKMAPSYPKQVQLSVEV
jgi:HSP20 family protein